MGLESVLSQARNFARGAPSPKARGRTWSLLHNGLQVVVFVEDAFVEGEKVLLDYEEGVGVVRDPLLGIQAFVIVVFSPGH